MAGPFLITYGYEGQPEGERQVVIGYNDQPISDNLMVSSEEPLFYDPDPEVYTGDGVPGVGTLANDGKLIIGRLTGFTINGGFHSAYKAQIISGVWDATTIPVSIWADGGCPAITTDHSTGAVYAAQAYLGTGHSSGANPSSILKSTDLGLNWTWLNNHLEFGGGGGGAIIDMAVYDGTGIALLDSGSIYKTTDHCVSWTNTHTGYVPLSSYKTTVHHLPTNNAFAICYTSHGLSISTDNGLTWVDKTPPSGATLLGIHEFGGAIYVCGYDAVGAKIWKSTNLGTAWTEFYHATSLSTEAAIIDARLVNATDFYYLSEDAGVYEARQFSTANGDEQITLVNSIPYRILVSTDFVAFLSFSRIGVEPKILVP